MVTLQKRFVTNAPKFQLGNSLLVIRTSLKKSCVRRSIVKTCNGGPGKSCRLVWLCHIECLSAPCHHVNVNCNDPESLAYFIPDLGYRMLQFDWSEAIRCKIKKKTPELYQIILDSPELKFVDASSNILKLDHVRCSFWERDSWPAWWYTMLQYETIGVLLFWNSFPTMGSSWWPLCFRGTPGWLPGATRKREAFGK